MTRQRVSYFYHNDVGNYQYAGMQPLLIVSVTDSAAGKGQHPMKPHRMRMVHDLIVNYDIHRKLDMCVFPQSSLHLSTMYAKMDFRYADNKACFLARHDKIPYRRVYRLP